MGSIHLAWFFRAALASLLLATLFHLPHDAHAQLDRVGVDDVASAKRQSLALRRVPRACPRVRLC
jgi:hypothetical protein